VDNIPIIAATPNLIQGLAFSRKGINSVMAYSIKVTNKKNRNCTEYNLKDAPVPESQALIVSIGAALANAAKTRIAKSARIKKPIHLFFCIHYLKDYYL
jgi:hypothetical protein